MGGTAFPCARLRTVYCSRVTVVRETVGVKGGPFPSPFCANVRRGGGQKKVGKSPLRATGDSHHPAPLHEKVESYYTVLIWGPEFARYCCVNGNGKCKGSFTLPFPRGCPLTRTSSPCGQSGGGNGRAHLFRIHIECKRGHKQGKNTVWLYTPTGMPRTVDALFTRCFYYSTVQYVH